MSDSAAPGLPRPVPRRGALAGALPMLGAMALLSVVDGIGKTLAARYPVWEVAWARFFFNLVVVLPFLLRRHRPVDLLRPARPLLQAARGCALVAASALYFAALAIVPLADTLALTFVSPLIVAALAPWLLKEASDRRTWAAVALGFAGTLLVARPSASGLQPGALLALGAGASYALFLIATRAVAGSSPPALTLGWTAAVGTVVTTLGLPFAWTTPTSASDLALMAALGAGAALAHLLMLRAFARTTAAALAPLTYLEIVGAAVVGYVAFGDFPDAPTWAGIAAIVAAGTLIGLGEPRPATSPAAQT